ncbi:inositol polyphosphate 5-phosphatase K-like isoform X2 [Leptopilina boulardi]|uniref:inositol polyphosphate 5-phosphatase K-like isoform X2 n=1 Tax=Leptopilina boulardi TaxID=63433 RepID=UPI0021F50F27|nr:inositol polyphosphate 5-phosphatase K-like isoform X2 [Leptopilina boulardi]
MMPGTEIIRLYFITWNVATKYPEEDLHDLLKLKNPVEHDPPDFYIIGLQEVKSQPHDLLYDVFFDDPWTKSFRDILKAHDYVKIKTQRLQGLMLNIFCLRKHISQLRSIEAKYTKTGFGGLWGNKGAVSVRLNIYGVSLCLINAHLTAHDNFLPTRISEYNMILREHIYESTETSNIFYHDYVFWFGDLNFRLMEGLTATDIDLLIKQKQLSVLLEKDQLKNVMANGEAFAELIENKISFSPTYKFQFSSQDYDLKRRPSWTDRILYKVNENVYENITLKAVQNSYKSHSNYVQSDHKPVTSEFDIVIRSVSGNQDVEFLPILEWFIDETNIVSYKINGNRKSGFRDWIGLYKDGFSSVDDYIIYEYVTTDIESDAPREASEETSEIKHLSFVVTAIKTPGMYRLVYFTQNSGIFGILGMSQAFAGHHR